MRMLQWLSVIPLIAVALAISHDWSSAAAAIVLTPLLWVPLVASAGLARREHGAGPRSIFNVAWWVYTIGYLLLLSPITRYNTAFEMVPFLLLTAWPIAVITAIAWRVQVRKAERTGQHA